MNFSSLNIQELQLEHSLDVNASSGNVTGMIGIPLSEGRNGFGPNLSLQYNSTSRSSIFGKGWTLSGLASISIDTKKGLPKYDGSDQYAFNGSNAIVPHLIKSSNDWVQKIVETTNYWVYYYRNKLESDFIRFEKWVTKSDNSIHWRSVTTTNVVSIYGLESTGLTKVFDPENENKTFIWLLESQYDNLGNAIRFRYKKENHENINSSSSFESNRLRKFLKTGFSQKYPEKILYGNTKPLLPDDEIPDDNKWLFEIVFDYGEYEARPYTVNIAPSGSVWKTRLDPFSVYTPGFELRTYRLCHRILLFHHFDELGHSSLTGIFENNYEENVSNTILTSVRYIGVRKDLITSEYSEKELPKITFNYTQPELGNSFKATVKDSTQNLPQGFNHLKTQFVDLFGEGLPGILTESANEWYYKPNMGNGVFGKQSIIIEKPSQLTGTYSLGDFDQDGNLNLFSLDGQNAGYYEYDREKEKWSGFTALQNIPHVGKSKFIDVDADGYPDLIVEREDKIVCYPFKGKKGFEKPYEFAKPVSNGIEYAPTLGGNLSLDYFLADMTGDGLQDQVRIKNGRISYYPNLGNGHFGEVVLMENSPVIDFDTTFDASRIRLHDLDGSGTTDILYIGNGEIRYWYNASGNAFIEGRTLTNLPYIDNISSAIILDFLGQGTPCLVWSNSLNNSQQSSLEFLELTNGIKPNLLISLANGMGKEEQIEYGYSGTHYLKTKGSSSPWISKMPSHFTVADKKIVIDHVTNTRFTTEFKYRDGQYDGNERSFITFGLVEQYDAEIFNNASLTHDTDYSQPSCTKTWLHSGIFGWDAKRAKQYYDKDAKHQLLIPQSFEQDEALEADDFVLAYHSLAVKILRQETYATTSEGQLAEHPFQVSQQAYAIRKLQPRTKNHDACFFAYQTETLNYTYEQNSDDPKISHHFSLAVNQYGDIEKEVSVSYARRSAIAGRYLAQTKDYITIGLHHYLNKDSLTNYQTGILYESKSLEVNHINRQPDSIYKLKDLQAVYDELIANKIEFDESLISGGSSKAKLTSWDRTYFWNEAFDDVLPFSQASNAVFAHHEESACFNDALITRVFDNKVTPAIIADDNEGNYIQKESYWWQHTAINHFKKLHDFYNLAKVERNPSNITTYKYDTYNLAIVEITDPLNNITKGKIDYNLVEPYQLIDQNDNVSEVLYDPLGVAIVNTHQGTVLDESNTPQKYGNNLIADYVKRSDENFSNILNNPNLYLQQAGTFLFYDFDSSLTKPLKSIRLVRENLVHDGKGTIDNNLTCQLGVDYQDGYGRIVQSKQKVEAGLAIQRKADGSIDTDAGGEPILSQSTNRWLVSGHVVYNNKQQAVRKFEPFFSTIVEFENDTELEEYGVSAQTYYDSVGRAYQVNLPNGTFTEIQFTPWEVTSYDQNDTVDRSLYKTFREFLPNTDPEKIALEQSLAHKDTPSTIVYDVLGREIVTIERNNDGTERKIEKQYDINGNVSQLVDARNILAFQYSRDMLGRLLYEKSNDAGEKWNFYNNYDQAIHFWDSRNIHQSISYDQLDRTTTIQVDGALGLNQLVERFVYGEDAGVVQAKEKNLRGGLVTHYDQAGIQTLNKAVPGGVPSLVERRLLDQFTSEPDWGDPSSVVLAADTFISHYGYDSLGRLIEQHLPDNTTRKTIFNRGGGVKKILVSTLDGELNEEEILKDTVYDAKGLRQKMVLGNNVELAYTYDIETFRMKRLRSRKISGLARTYQDINYTYDSVGNLINTVDQAQQPASANPKVLEGLNVSSHSEFEYDALYQLKRASGRVHQALVQNDYSDRSRETSMPSNWGKGTRHITLNNGAAVERYTRNYEFDLAGNIKSIRHSGTSQNWTKQLWTSTISNRSLPLFDLNGIEFTNFESRFDSNGNCISMSHLQNIEWNYRNNISKVVVIDRSTQGKSNDEEYYVYGGDGTRIRKITQKVVDVSNNTLELTEKIYLDGCEIKRIVRGTTELLKRFTSQITDGKNNLATIHSWIRDTNARETDNINQKKIHYQLGNHLGSASLELDENGDVITYEEYFPYGGTAFIARRNKREIDLKSYRYSAKERDDFTGLYYFGYRYYAHWIGGWINPDPLGPEDSENLYLYVHNNPINLIDPNGLQSTSSDLHVIGQVETGLTEAQAMSQFNISQGARLGVRVLDLEKQGDNWIVVRHRELTATELQRFRDIQEQWIDHPEIAEMFTMLEVTLSDLGNPLEGLEGGAGGGEGIVGEGSEVDNGSDTSHGTGEASEGSGVSVNSSGSGDANTGDGTGSDSQGQTTGEGDGNTGVGDANTGDGANNGTGTRERTGRGTGRTGSGTGSRGRGTGSGTGSTGHPSGRAGGSPTGVVGGEIGGSPEGTLGGSLEGHPDGSLEGNTNGHPDGIPNGTLEGAVDGSEESSGTGEGSSSGDGNESGRTESSGEGEQGEGEQGDPQSNWLDTVTHWTGYLNLEFGSDHSTGVAGGIPGGMDLLGWRPPMWVRRICQVAYIATTIITTVIPIGKAALAAKVAIQGALKVGLKATATKLLTAIAAKIPSRAAMAAGASQLGHAMAAAPVLFGAMLRRTPQAVLRPTAELLERVASHPNALRGIANEVHLMGNVFGETLAVTRATLKNGDDVFFAAINSGARRLNPSQIEAIERLGINVVPQYFRNIPIMRKIYHAEVNMIHHLGDAPLGGLRWGISMVGNKASHLCGDCLRRIRMFDRQMGISSVIENLL